jgi:hypothetical protein
MTNALPSRESIQALITNIDGVIGLGASFPSSQYFEPSSDDKDRYRELWQTVDTDLAELRKAGFPIPNPNPHKDLKSMWAWCISQKDRSITWNALRGKVPYLYAGTIANLAQLKETVSHATAPLEVQREFRESAQRTRELFIIMAFRPETNKFRNKAV